MIVKQYIDEHLAKTYCHRCGNNLEGASLVPISKVPLALIAHVVCPKCQAESIVTITMAGSGAMPVVSDLTGEEMKKFMGASSTSHDELLDLHKMLRKESICNLLQKEEKNLEKRQKKSGKKEKSLP